MPDPIDLDGLQPRQVTLSLQHLTADLNEGLTEPLNGFVDVDGAVSMLRAFIDSMPTLSAASSQLDTVDDAARAALRMALSAPEVSEFATDLVQDPPGDDQMGVEELPQYIAVVGFVVAFLQTRFNIRVTRSGGSTDVHFEVGKDPLEGEQLGQFMAIAGKLAGVASDEQ